MYELKEHSENTLIVKPHFNIDMENFDNVSKLKDELLEKLEQMENPILILDLEECDFIDSTGLGNILRIYEQIRRKKGKVLACHANENISDLFDITTVNKLIETHLTLDDALKSIRS